MSVNHFRGFQYMNGDYVYYQRLSTDNYYPRLAGLVNIRNTLRVQKASNLDMIASFFETAASQELNKEMALLNEKFGTSISGKYEDTNFAKDLISALNECLGIKDVFERNLALIKESKGQKNVMSFFPTYFEKVWVAHNETIYNEAVQKYTNSDSLTFGDAAYEVINEYLPEMVKEAVINMFKAGVETGIKKEHRDQYAAAYQEMSDALQANIKGSNEFIKSFIQHYHLQELAELAKESVDSQSDFNARTTDSFNFKAQMASRGGMTMEEVRTYAINIIGEGLRALHGSATMPMTVEGTSTGDTKQKADSIATIDLPLNIISDWVEKNNFGDRQKNVAAILQLQQQLKNFNDGFVTYVNAKNYTLNNNFRHGAVHSNGDIQLPGFSAGSKISLGTFQGIANQLNINYDDLVDVCLQIIPGAIGADAGTIENVKIALTRAIASALFDDFNMVGSIETTGAKSVHLLDLNGVLMPISFYFYLLSEAFGRASTMDLEDLISVEIDTPSSILYPNKFPEERLGGGEARWNEQSVDALTKIKIGYHFLAAFQEIMQAFV